MDTKKALEGTISWKTDTTDSISDFSINGKWVGISGEDDTLNLSLSYANRTMDAKIEYNNTLLYSGVMAFHYALAGDFPKNFSAKQTIDLWVTKWWKKVIDLNLTGDAQTGQNDTVDIKTPTDFIKMEDINFWDNTGTLAP